VTHLRKMMIEELERRNYFRGRDAALSAFRRAVRAVLWQVLDNPPNLPLLLLLVSQESAQAFGDRTLRRDLSLDNIAEFALCRTCRSGRAMARTGLRMMPTFPSSPLKFRTAGFPQYGFKVGYRKVPSQHKAPNCRAHLVCIPPSRSPLSNLYIPGLCRGSCALEHRH
jgi:hypothetical protein